MTGAPRRAPGRIPYPGTRPRHRPRRPVVRAVLLGVLTVASPSAPGAEASRDRTDSTEPPAVIVSGEARPYPRNLPGGRGLGLDLEFGVDYRSPGTFRCSVRLPLAVRTALEGDLAGRSDAAWGDPSLEVGAVLRRGGTFRSLGAAYAAPLGRRSEDTDRPLRPVPGSGFHRLSVSAGWGRIRDPVALSAGFSWTVSLPLPGDPEPVWRPGDLTLSLSLVEVVNDSTGILLGLRPGVRLPARGPGAGPEGDFAWDLEARVEVHLRARSLFLRAGVSRSLADPDSGYTPAVGAEYEFRIRRRGGG